MIQRIKRMPTKIPKNVEISAARNQTEKIFKLIRRDCSDYLQISRSSHSMLYRGIDIGIPAFRSQSLAKRQPVDTSKFTQAEIDRDLANSGFKALRGNSIFVTSDYNVANAYGNTYIIFPVNGFEFTYSKKIQDMYSTLQKYNESWQAIVFEEGLTWNIETYMRKFSVLCYKFQACAELLKPIVATKLLNSSEPAAHLDGKLANKLINQIGDKIEEVSLLIETVFDEDYQTFSSALTQISFICTKFMRLTDILLANTRTYKALQASKSCKECFNYFLEHFSKPKKAPSWNSIAKQAIKQMGFTNQDLITGISTGHEIYIKGKYYALNDDLFADAVVADLWLV